MRPILARAAAAVALCVAGAAWLGAAPRPDAFGAGILRRDGVIVPFAAFDGRKWIDNWPLPDAEVEVPITLRDLPASWWGPTKILDRWQAWIAGNPQLLTVKQPDWVDVHCTRQIGLRTDYKPMSEAPPPSEQPYPKDGLALSPPQAVEPIAIVPPESSETRALIPMVQEAFNKEERQAEDVRNGNYPVPRRAREGRAPDLEAIYAIGDHPRIYYVEATRSYRILGREHCTAMAFGAFWFAIDGTQTRELESSVALLSCDRRGASYMLPLGAMRLDGKLYWLAQFSGWDHERYVVVEIKKKSVTAVVNAWGGSCS